MSQTFDIYSANKREIARRILAQEEIIRKARTLFPVDYPLPDKLLAVERTREGILLVSTPLVNTTRHRIGAKKEG